MSDPVKSILKIYGPMLSSTLASCLVRDYGYQPPNARKLVQRGCEGMKKLGGIKFPHRARFVYLQSDYGSPYFWQALIESMRSTNSAYFTALSALTQRDCLMPKRHFLIACGGPVAQSGHISAEHLLEHLKEATLVTEVDVPVLGRCVSRVDIDDAISVGAKVRARLIVEEIMLDAIKSWARELNLVAYNNVQLRDEGDTPPKVGTFYWDFSAPSYLFPLLRGAGADHQPGFVVCDLLLKTRVDLNSVSAFLKKCVTLRNLSQVGRCVQIFVAHSYTAEAFDALKKQGVIPATSDNLFGKDVARSLKQLAAILSDTAQSVVIDPDKIDFIFRTLGAIEGAANTLRGSLFEYIVGDIVRSTLSTQDIEINRIIRVPNGNMAEIDVVATIKNKAVHFIECKGHHPMGVVDDKEVDVWLDERIATIRNYAKLHTEWKELPQHFELWTSGKFSDYALSRLAQVKSENRKFSVEFRDQSYVLSQAAASNNSSLLKTYKQHFVDNPLRAYDTNKKRAERKLRRDQARLQQPTSNAVADTSKLSLNSSFAPPLLPVLPR